MTREEFKIIQKEKNLNSPWRAMFLEYDQEENEYVNDLASVLDSSTMSELDKLYFVERWHKASEVGRVNLEQALIMDVERKATLPQRVE